MEKRYLVYKSWNGQIHASIEHGDLTDGHGIRKNDNELKRIELKDYDSDDFSILKIKYPVGEIIE